MKSDVYGAVRRLPDLMCGPLLAGGVVPAARIRATPVADRAASLTSSERRFPLKDIRVSDRHG